MPKIEISRALITLFISAIVIGIVLLVLTNFSNARKERIYNTYAQETQSYIARNKESFNKLFKEMFPKEVCNLTDTSLCPQRPTGDEIGGMLTQDIKDWSSIEFIKLNNGKILTMGLSGYVSEFYIYPEDKKAQVVALLNGRQDKIPWDTYAGYGQKQVIIPVKDDSGQVIGAIVRGVIER
jgi:hypothetical protein